jgi:hypothetical protein
MDKSLELDKDERKQLLFGTGHDVYVYMERCLQAIVRPTIAPKLDRIADDIESIFSDPNLSQNEKVLQFSVLLSKFSRS